MTMNNKAVENIMKTFSDVTIEPSLQTVIIIAESFGVIDLKMIRESGFEIQSINQQDGKVVIHLMECDGV
jgi:hypothetical protein